MRWVPVLVALAGIVTTGCGSLRVEVAVLDPEVLEQALAEQTDVEDATLLRRELPRILALASSDVDRVVDEIAQDHFSFYGEAADILTELGAPRSAVALQDDFAAMIVPVYNDAKAELNRILETLGDLVEARRGATGEQEERLTGEILLELRRWQGVVRELQEIARRDIASLQEHLAEQYAPDPDQKRRLEIEVETTLAEQSRKLILLSTGTLDADPLVAAVAGAEKDDWLSRFHQVFGRGFLGNFNLAIKMEKGPSEKTFPEFTLKGLTFDPSDVARMASRVTSQALALGAVMAGVPLADLSGESTPAAGTAIATAGSPLAVRQQEVAAAEQAERTHDAALQNLAVAVLQAWPELTSDDVSVRKAALDALRASHAALAPNLRSASSPAEDEVVEEEEPEPAEEEPEEDEEEAAEDEPEEPADEPGESEPEPEEEAEDGSGAEG